MFARGFHARRWHCPRACGEVHLVPNVGVSRDPEVFEISAPCPRRNTVKSNEFAASQSCGPLADPTGSDCADR